MQLGVTDSI